MWEFVGGKVEPNESPEDAIIREFKEEVGISVAVRKMILPLDYEYTDMKMHFMLFEVEHLEGEIKKLEHNDLRFIKFSEWDNLCFCEACEPIKKFIGEYY